MNIQANLETWLLLGGIAFSSIGSYLIIRNHWTGYGTLFLLSAAVGETICYVFVKLGFYSFPFRLFPHISPMPFMEVLTIVPFYVLLGVRFSPQSWPWKIPFYWVFVHVGMLTEVWLQNRTWIVRYDRFWDSWDSYTWWWIYLLIFERIGGLLVPEQARRPLNPDFLRFGKLGWFILHFILIVTIFLAGVYVGRITQTG